MESSKQEAEDRSRSGLKQTAAAIIEPNVIDIDAALAQMGDQKDRRSEKQTEAERKKDGKRIARRKTCRSLILHGKESRQNRKNNAGRATQIREKPAADGN